MESHEEKLLAMVQESKMNQAKELMKRKEKELQSKQPAPSGFSFFTSLISGVVAGVSNTVRGVDAAASKPTNPTPAPAPAPVYEPSYAFQLCVDCSHEVVSSLGHGMKLSGAKKESLSVGLLISVDV